MSNTLTPPNGTKQPPVAPEERFWQRYSPHHEAPVSGFSSVLLHLGIVGLIAGTVFWLGRQTTTRESPLQVIPVIAEGGDGGTEARGPAGGAKQEDVGPSASAPARPNGPEAKPQPELPPVAAPPLTLPKPATGELLIPANRQMVEQLQQAADAVRHQLLRNMADDPDKKGGPAGTPGQKGPGGDGGPGRPGVPGGRMNQQQQRQIRWHLKFNTRGGDEYVRQLASLGAILAVPEEDGSYRVIRDLKKLPAAGAVEDVSKIKRIFWVDSNPGSVQSLAKALGLRKVPPYVAAFFPKALEDELLKKELTYRGLREDQIRETRFELTKDGDRYVPEVLSQK